MGNKPFWEIRAATDNPKKGELLLYGDISTTSWWGDEVTPKQFHDDLQALGEIDELWVYLLSGGGDVFAGQAIYSMLKRHTAKKTVYIDGLAASIASVIAMAGDTVIMPANSMMMIHNPWAVKVGNAADFRKMADDLDKIRESMIAAYLGKSGMERDKLIAMLDAETWLSAEEAVSNHLADQVEESKQVAASLGNGALVVNGLTVDLSRFRTAPTGKVQATVVQGAGRMLSAENEDLIRSAHGALGTVLAKLDSPGDGESAAHRSAPATASGDSGERADSSPLSSWSWRIQANRNRLMGGTKS